MKKWLSLLILALCIGSADVVRAEVTLCSLSWNANTESDLKGYRVYESIAPAVIKTLKSQVGKVTTYDCSGISDDKVHSFHMTAIDDAGSRTDGTKNPNGDNESLPSITVSKLFKTTATPVTIIINNVGTTNLVVGFEAVPSRLLTAGENVEFWLDGVLSKTEGISPYCFGTESAPPITCGPMSGTAGSHVLEARLVSNGIILDSHTVSYTIAVIDIIRPNPPVITIQ